MQLMVKKCTKNIGWQPPVQICNHTQTSYDLANKCPDEYVGVTDELCIQIHSRRPFQSDICNENLVALTIYNLTNSELESLFTYLNNYSSNKSFWLLAKQTIFNESLRTGSWYTIDELGLQWTMPAFLGERVVVHDRCPTCTFRDRGGCLAFQPTLNSDNRFNSSVVNCNLNSFHSFCLVRKNDTLRRLACPNGYVAPLIPKRLNLECSVIHQFEPVNVAEIPSKVLADYCPNHAAYQLNSIAATYHFEQLAKLSMLSSHDRCLFGIAPGSVVVNSSLFVDVFVEHRLVSFVNWDLSMGIHEFNASSNDTLSTDYRGKWFWESDQVSCIVCSQSVDFKFPRLELNYDSIKISLTLIAVNYNFLVTRTTNNLPFMCYAKVHNQYSPNVQTTIISATGTEMISDVKLMGPGSYWCSGYAIYSAGRFIDSGTVFAQGFVMAMTVEFDCRPNNCNSFESSFWSFLNWQGLGESLEVRNVTCVNITYPGGVIFADILFHVSVNVIDEEALRTEQNLLNLPDEMLTYYYIRQKFVHISNRQNVNTIFRIRSVNSTDFCLPSSISVLDEINWMGARIGETIESIERCFDANGRPILRMCVGDALHGVNWLSLSSEAECNIEDSSDLTDDLQYLVDNFDDPEQTEDIIEKVRHLVTNSSDRFVRMDLFFVSQIVGRATSFLEKRPFSSSELRNLVVIYNNLMQVDRRVARSSAAFNSTNVLLYSLEQILVHEASAMFGLVGHPSIDGADFSYCTTVNVRDRGVICSTSQMLINIVIDPELTDVSGVAIFRPSKDSQRFDARGLKDYRLQYLYRNQSFTDLLLRSDLLVASYFPSDLLSHILVTNPDAKLLFSIYYNDILFQTVDNTTYVKSDGKIIAVSVPGLKKLPGMIPIYVQPEDSVTDYCGFWDYNHPDGWSDEGCFRFAQNPSTRIVLCVCSHLTNFAYLLKGNSSQFDGIHSTSLQWITVLGCTLSLIGILGIYITAMQFRSWRSKTSTKYLLQLSTAIAFQMILLAFVNTAPMTQLLLLTNNEAWCIVIGVLLHYFVLAMFFWMLIIAYLQFIRYVIVFNQVKAPRFLLKSSLLGWTLPMIPVLLVVAIDRHTYVPDLYFSESQICYPSGYSLYFGVLLPIGTIVGANLVIFVLVNYNLLRGTNAVCKAGDRNTKLSQLRLSIFLFFLLGLTWIFGLISTAFSETSVVFSYLFCLTSTLQGFVMFLYFVILDPVARNLWIYCLKRMFCSKKGNIDIRKDTSSKDSF